MPPVGEVPVYKRAVNRSRDGVEVVHHLVHDDAFQAVQVCLHKFDAEPQVPGFTIVQDEGNGTARI